MEERYKLICLVEGGILHMSGINDNSVQSSIIQHDNTVCFLGKSFQSQHRIIRLYNNFTRPALIVDWKNTVSL
jgi:hypothetical protein